ASGARRQTGRAPRGGLSAGGGRRGWRRASRRRAWTAQYEEDESHLGDPAATGKRREIGVKRLVTGQEQQRDREHAAHARPGEYAGKRQALGGGRAGGGPGRGPGPGGGDRPAAS